MLKLVAAIAALLVLLPVCLFAAVCICAWTPRRQEKADCLLVLGARVHSQTRMSKALEYRCRKALELWRAGAAQTMILCGGQCTVDPCPESHVMRAFFLENGVPDADILLEDSSINTIQNLKHAKAMMEARGYSRAALITSDYHLTRALWIARSVGLDVCGVAAESPADAYSYIKVRVKECFSWLLYFKRKLKGRGRL